MSSASQARAASAVPIATRILLLALAYVVTGWLGLQMPSVGNHITLVWLPTGIAIGALLRWGPHIWPGVYIGAFLVNLFIGSPWPLAASIAVGNTLGPLATFALLRKAGFNTAFGHRDDITRFGASTLIGMLLPAAGGVVSLRLAGALPPEAVGNAWLTWWMGDSVGALLGAPLLLALTRKNFQHVIQRGEEFSVWLLFSCVIGWLAFMQDFDTDTRLPLGFITLPALAWAALRLGNIGAAVAGPLFSVFAVWGTATGRGTFAVADTETSLLLMWSYMAVIVMSQLLIMVLQDERIRVEDTLRESEEKLRTLFELSPLGIALNDLQGRFIEFNDAFRAICGYTTEELKALDYWTLTPDKYRPQETELLESLERTGRYGPYQKEYRRKDGGLVPLRLNCVLVVGRDGQPYIWSLVEDISVSKQHEMELHAAKVAAEAASRSKSEFLATMSHEIRTPLHGILGLAQVMLMQSDENKNGMGAYEEYVRTIIHSGNTLLVLLNDILDMSKIEAGRLQLEMRPVGPEQVMQETAMLFSEQAGEKGLALACDWQGEAGARYLSDPLRLRQMLSNLVSNAIKFTAHGHIRIEGRELFVEDGQALLEFTVTDTGIGIPSEKQSMLFQPFSQVDASTTREYGGSGLGLSIVRELATLMGGDVGVSSKVGEGTRMWIRIRAECLEPEPMPPPERRSSSPQPAAPPPAQTARSVLVVEDNVTNRLVIQGMLNHFGISHTSVDNGQQAVDYVASGRRPKLILMDCLMPVMDGYDATIRIREWERKHAMAKLPIVALTASAFNQDKERCLQVGMDDVLTKPLDIKSLKEVLDKWLEASELQR